MIDDRSAAAQSSIGAGIANEQTSFADASDRRNPRAYNWASNRRATAVKPSCVGWSSLPHQSL